MKTRKNIRDAFKYNGGGTSIANELQTASITSIETYPDNINDFYVYYTYDESDYKISFSDGQEAIL